MLSLAILLGLFSVIGVAGGILVYRADTRRWDNRVLALMMFVDAFTEASRAAHVLDAGSLSSHALLRTCLASSLVTAWLTVEFAYSFPFDRRMPARGRAVGLVAVTTSLFLTYWPPTAAWFIEWATFLFFLPTFGVTSWLLVQNLRRASAERRFAGIPLIMAGVAGRWVSSLAAYVVAERLGAEAFEAALRFDATVSMFACYALFAYALLKYHLFRVAGVLAELVLYGGFAASGIGILYLGVDLIADAGLGPMQLRATLVGYAILPIALVTLARWLLPKLEDKVLQPIDPRRAELRGVLEELFQRTAGKVDSSEVLQATIEAAGRAAGGPVRFLAGDDEAALARAKTDDEVLVTVRHEARVFGALALPAASLDRDARLGAVTMAQHLALKLENFELFRRMLDLRGELDESKRLATLGAFAAAIAHDLRTPLTSVQLNVQILRRRSQLPEDDLEYFDIALEELRRVNQHISELLDYAKPVQVTPTELDLRELADEAAKSVGPIFGERRLSLVKDYGEVPTVLADGGRLRQVLLNLLENAAQASEAGGAIHVRARRDEGHVVLDVADEGRGIAAEHLPKIFEPFFTTRPDGTGLGLAIAQKLVRAHGGELRVESTLGRGSTFSVRLPTTPRAATLPVS